MFLITHIEPERVPPTSSLDARQVWIGTDNRGVELENVAPDLPDEIIVIHVMPTEFER